MQLALLSGCTAFSNVTRWSWTEEVELSSGQIVLVDRWEERHKLGGIVQRGSQVFVRAGLRFNPSNGPLPEIAWEGRVSPVAIDITLNGDVYLVTRFIRISASHEYPPLAGEPLERTHVAFRLVAEKWKQILLTDLPPKLPRNLLINTDQWVTGEERIDRPVVTIARKTRFDARLDSRGRQIMGDFTYTPSN